MVCRRGLNAVVQAVANQDRWIGISLNGGDGPLFRLLNIVVAGLKLIRIQDDLI